MTKPFDPQLQEQINELLEQFKAELSDRLVNRESDNICAACEYHGKNALALAKENEKLKKEFESINYELEAERFSANVADDAAKVLRKLNPALADVTVSMGIGDGHGQLFVYGDHDSIKIAKKKIFELERLRAENAELRQEVSRLMSLPELEWAKVTNRIMQHFASLSRNGFSELAQDMTALLDLGRTYVNRIRNERDTYYNQLEDARKRFYWDEGE